MPTNTGCTLRKRYGKVFTPLYTLAADGMVCLQLLCFLFTGSIVSIFIYSDTPGKKNSAELKINSIQNSDQHQVLSTAPKETKRFTPAINEIKPADHRAANLTELYLNGHVFDLPAENEMRSGLNVNNNVNNVQEQDATQ